MAMLRPLPPLIAILLIGCQAKPKRPPAGYDAATPQTLAALRTAYSHAYPDSRVGPVIGALPKDRLVAVGEVNPNDFRTGEIVTFIDSQQRVLTTGTIVRILPDQIHIQYDHPSAGGRDPAV